MNKLLGKVMVFAACAIILLHAVVPHHHHECCGESDIFHACEHHDGHDHESHPFDTCMLQEMLSHLVISTRDDQNEQAVVAQPLTQALMPVWTDMGAALDEPLACPVRFPHGASVPLPKGTANPSSPLRAPPAC